MAEPTERDTQSKHIWAAPPAGQGGRTQRICKKCGGRLTVVGRDSMCTGIKAAAMTEQLADYEPF